MNLVPDVPGPLGQKRRMRWGWRWRMYGQPIATLLTGLLPRLLDILLALFLLILLSPLLLTCALIAWRREGRILRSQPLIGYYRRPFQRLFFAGSSPWPGLPVLFNILRGDMAFAGPRPLSPEEEGERNPADHLRFSSRPGLFSLYSLRRKVGIAYDDEAQLDAEFYYDETAMGNAGMLTRALIGSLLAGNRARLTPDTFNMFGVTIANTTMDQAIEWIMEHARSKACKLAAFVNPDCLNVAHANANYRSVLRRAGRVWPDGIGINLGLRILGLSLKANVNGTDLFPLLCQRADREGVSLYLLGARPGIARLAAENMQSRFPGLKIAGTRHGYFASDEDTQVIADINHSGADILLAAFGAPRQELWLDQHLAELKTGVAIGVGGLFDFYSGRIRRAPPWMREIGLEWTWRLLQEPGRMWRRYVIGNPLFLYRVYRQQIRENSA